MFKAVVRESAVDACARAIREKILGGEVGVGERLPPERQLAEAFGVNRVTVRGALAQLAAERLLSVRQGSGYVVRDYLREAGPGVLPGLASLAQRGELVTIVSDLLLVRRHLAQAVLLRLSKAKSVDPRPVVAAVDAMEAVVESGGDHEAVARADIGVVSALLGLTKSHVLQLCMNPVAEVVLTMPALRETIYAKPKENIEGWRVLCAWLEKRWPESIPALVETLEERDVASVTRLKRRKK